MQQNIFYSHIDEIRKGQFQWQVQLCTAGGQYLAALISKNSAERLGLRPGGQVWAEIKAHAVHLHLRNSQTTSSVDNCYFGELVGMTRGRVSWECVVDIGAGTLVRALLSAHYAATLGLRSGKGVWVSFNSFAVILCHPRVGFTGG